MIELFQKFAEYEAEPHFNARPSGLATALQNHEAPLRDFGRSQYFRKCESVALRHPARPCRARYACGAICFASRNVKVKIRLADFSDFIIFRLGFRLGGKSFAKVLTAHPNPSRKREGRDRVEP